MLVNPQGNNKSFKNRNATWAKKYFYLNLNWLSGTGLCGWLGGYRHQTISPSPLVFPDPSQ
jgi:hypothetical protein